MKNKEYSVSVLVLTYNPDKEKLFLTLKSILLQKGIRFQIVLADDGSEINFFNCVKEYFDSINFTNYALVANPINRGTVMNAWSGIKLCEGKYVKFISPGDLLYGETVLADWISDTEGKGSDISFSDAVYYQMEQKDKDRFIHILKMRAAPQRSIVYMIGGGGTA